MLAVMGLLPWTARVSANGSPSTAATSPDCRAPSAVDPGKDIAIICRTDHLLEPVLHRRLPAHRGDPRARGASRTEAPERAIALLDQVGIPAPDSRLRAFPRQLSAASPSA